MKYKFYGSSDDLFMVDLNERPAEECYPPQHYTLDNGEGEGCCLTADYIDNGVWAIAISPLDEDVPIPSNWVITAGAENYTGFITIETEDEGVYMRVVGGDDE